MVLAGSHAQASEDIPLDSLLYEVTAPGGVPPSYLLGTLHTSDEDVNAAIAYAYPKLRASTQAWFELVSTPQDGAIAASRMFLPPSEGEGLKRMLSAEEFSLLLGMFQTYMPQIPPQFIARYKPWAAAVSVQMMGLDTSGIVMDDRLQQAAKDAGLALHALETIASQFDVFEQLSQREQLEMLREALRKDEENQALNDQMLEYYIAGNLGGLYGLLEESYAMLPSKELAEKINRFLVEERNNHMAETLLPHLQREGGLFIAVGALHLPGETGLLTRLQQAGLRVTPIYPPEIKDTPQ